MSTKQSKNPFLIPEAEKYLSTLLPRLQEKRVQSFTTIVFSLITLSVFGIFAIAPTLSTITDLQKQITDSDYVNQQLQEKIGNLTALQEEYRKIQPDLPVVYAAIPEDPEVTQLVGQLQTIADNSQVVLNNVQTLPVDISAQSSTQQYNSFTFAMDISGTYENIQTFLKTLTGFDRITTLDALALTKPLSKDDGYTLSIRGKVYFIAKQ